MQEQGSMSMLYDCDSYFSCLSLFSLLTVPIFSAVNFILTVRRASQFCKNRQTLKLCPENGFEGEFLSCVVRSPIFQWLNLEAIGRPGKVNDNFKDVIHKRNERYEILVNPPNVVNGSSVAETIFSQAVTTAVLLKGSVIDSSELSGSDHFL